ncbi:MAG: hypothetical protein K0R92_71 [Lachnospiraceae bacterium]|jgi:uncharacterized protein (DUF2164 family)|nr:hypothetical protein [Lachnospiraceae bacterium]
MYSFKENDKKAMLGEIAYFFKEEYDLDLGIIGTDNIFDFFTEMMGDRIYNMALNDAKRFYKKYAEEMETDFYALFKDER